VSPRIRAEWANGREYYALEGRSIARPVASFAPPRAEYLEWHGDVVFRV
jgi:putative restriction endonuclease